MGTPTWRRVDSVVSQKVPERAGVIWTPVIDYVTPGRLYLIKVGLNEQQEDQKWKPDGGTPCSADGDAALMRSSGVVPLADVPIGALIARIGGSTADAAGDKERVWLF